MAEHDTDTAAFIQSVVHPTDFSAASARAFAHALAVAVLRRSSLTLLHVGNEEQADWGKYPAVRATLERWGMLEAGSTQADVFRRLGVQVTKVSVASRFPALAVVDYLAENPADLLVVATEGRSGSARWLHGSVAEAMARRSTTMTLFVPADSERDIITADGKLTFTNVLIPIDHAPDATAAIDFAMRAADIFGDGNTTLTLLHIGSEQGAPRVHAPDGEPVAQIAAAAEQVRADLIVMPTAGRSGAFEALRGSTTERVLRQAPCAVLAVPARQARPG
jgi:nucleotide-binding universal stress UspA family protein